MYREADILKYRVEIPPSMGAGFIRINGFEVIRMKRRNAAATNPCTERTFDRSVAGKLPLNQATKAPKNVRISTHRSIDPSWFPHTPVTLKSIGFAECEFSQTFATEKSD